MHSRFPGRLVLTAVSHNPLTWEMGEHPLGGCGGESLTEDACSINSWNWGHLGGSAGWCLWLSAKGYPHGHTQCATSSRPSWFPFYLSLFIGGQRMIQRLIKSFLGALVPWFLASRHHRHPSSTPGQLLTISLVS